MAGFVDAIIGGGGLIQTPATFFTLPNVAVPSVLGTTKIPSFMGSGISAFQYSRKVILNLRLLLPIAGLAFLASLAGSYTLTLVPNQLMKPFALVILILVFVYTFFKKDFGNANQQDIPFEKQLKFGLLMGAIVGFYDGFFGPGTGSFFVLGFISFIGFDFLKASAHAKIVNLSTNLASVLFFGFKGAILYSIAFPMAIANVCGAFLGARLAILKGNQFIRIFFLFVIAATILRFGYDLFF